MSIDHANGKWNLKSSDNFDNYMKALGVSLPTRLIVGKLKPDVEITTKDDEWTIKTTSTFKNTESSFKLNTPFKETTPDGRNVEVKCTVEGNKLIRKETGEVATTTIREFTATEHKVTLEYNGVTCTRIYHRSTTV